MHKRFFAGAILALAVIVTLPLGVLAQNSNPAIDVGESTWSKTTLRVLIILNQSQSWWQSYFENITERAVEQWNQAFTYFADKYPQYNYLSKVSLTTTAANQSLPNYDIYIVFSPNVLISGVDALGDTLVHPALSGTIEYVNITLSAKSQVVDLTRQDYRDTTTHELGHAIGLGHSNDSRDLMYPYQDIVTSQYAISTLDLYGVSLLFERSAGQANATYRVPQSTALPNGVPYEYAPVQNPAPTTWLDNPFIKTLQIILFQPITLALIVALIFMIIMLGLAVRRRRKLSVGHRYSVR